jgi:hypothetical protein
MKKKKEQKYSLKTSLRTKKSEDGTSGNESGS